MANEFDTHRSSTTLLAIIGISLAWGLLAGVLVFVGFSISGRLFAGILFGPTAFIIGTFLACLCQIRRAKTLPTSGAVGYSVFLLLFLLLLWYFAFGLFHTLGS
ncbi:MAG: hypothetical protein O7D27_12310 [Alphaproteobacteria bacterium]|nr:hypothetical protein [Alphaproteobacteria bacterium]MCZ6848712.1 hypothetical protein [Alphaproteobacteria bacterium]